MDISDSDIGKSINELAQAAENFEHSTIEHSNSCGTLVLNLSWNKKIGRECSDGIAFVRRFKKLKGLKLSENCICPQGAMVLADFVLYSSSCHVLECLNLSGNAISPNNVTKLALKLLHHDRLNSICLSDLIDSYGTISLSGQQLNDDGVTSFARDIQLMQDFNYSQNFFSPICIELSDFPMDTQTAVAVLRKLKNCNRVKGVDIRDTGIMYGRYTITNFKKSFEHHKIRRHIVMNGENITCFTNILVPPCSQ